VGAQNELAVELGQREGGPLIAQPTPTGWLQEVEPFAAVKVTLTSKLPPLEPVFTLTAAAVPVPVVGLVNVAPAVLLTNVQVQLTGLTAFATVAEKVAVELSQTILGPDSVQAGGGKTVSTARERS
jgi:hypothetical protein